MSTRSQARREFGCRLPLTSLDEFGCRLVKSQELQGGFARTCANQPRAARAYYKGL